MYFLNIFQRFFKAATILGFMEVEAIFYKNINKNLKKTRHLVHI